MEDAPVPLNLTIVTHGIHHSKMDGLLKNSCESFETIVHIPTAKRGGARLQSSLVVATAVAVYTDSDDVHRIAGGQYAEIVYRYSR